MKFWDSSALLPLLIWEPTTAEMTRMLKEDKDVIVWWAAETECVSAIARLERDQNLTTEETSAVLRRLDLGRKAWHEVQPLEALKTSARRLLRVHTLRAADALQLAAAIAASQHDPSSLPFVCLDERLRTAAEKEGFTVLPMVSA